jgi:hypothetical protein
MRSKNRALAVLSATVAAMAIAASSTAAAEGVVIGSVNPVTSQTTLLTDKLKKAVHRRRCHRAPLPARASGRRGLRPRARRAGDRRLLPHRADRHASVGHRRGPRRSAAGAPLHLRGYRRPVRLDRGPPPWDVLSGRHVRRVQVPLGRAGRGGRGGAQVQEGLHDRHRRPVRHPGQLAAQLRKLLPSGRPGPDGSPNPARTSVDVGDPVA